MPTPGPTALEAPTTAERRALTQISDATGRLMRRGMPLASAPTRSPRDPNSEWK